MYLCQYCGEVFDEPTVEEEKDVGYDRFSWQKQDGYKHYYCTAVCWTDYCKSHIRKRLLHKWRVDRKQYRRRH